MAGNANGNGNESPNAQDAAHPGCAGRCLIPLWNVSTHAAVS
jgi:hypothetical protein